MVKSSNPLGCCSILGFWPLSGILKTNIRHESFCRILKNNVTQYDVTLIYAVLLKEGENTNGLFKEIDHWPWKKYLQINNKTIIKFGSRRYDNTKLFISCSTSFNNCFIWLVGCLSCRTLHKLFFHKGVLSGEFLVRFAPCQRPWFGASEHIAIT